MDLQKEKQKIEKALRVIDLIETCNWQIESFTKYKKTRPTFANYYRHRITIMQGVKERLQNYYKNLIK